MDREWLKSLGLTEEQMNILTSELDETMAQVRTLNVLKAENERLKEENKGLEQVKIENKELKNNVNTRSVSHNVKENNLFKMSDGHQKRLAREEIMAIKDNDERQDLIRENWGLFK